MRGCENCPGGGGDGVVIGGGIRSCGVCGCDILLVVLTLSITYLCLLATTF